jgi:outer membrane protein TolC
MRVNLTMKLKFLSPVLLAFGAMVAAAQSYGGASNSIPTPRPLDPASNSTNPSASATQVQNPYLGSVPSMPLVEGTLQLSLEAAVQLALRSNLGLIDATEKNTAAYAARMQSLSELLPQLNASASQHYATLQTIGGAGRLMGLAPLYGPYSYQSVQLNLEQTAFDAHELYDARAASANAHAAAFNNLDSRNIVVLAAASAYLAIAASQSRLQADQAQLSSADAIQKLMQDRVDHSVSPQIDLIRATVAAKTAAQRVELARIQMEKDKLSLTRIIGLPIEQQFAPSTPLTYREAPATNPDDLLAMAREHRADLRASEARLQASELSIKAAEARRLPSIHLGATVGSAGYTPSHLYTNYDVGGSIRMPLFTGGAIASDVTMARSEQSQRRAELQDLEARVQFDLRTALLDLDGAKTSVSVARQNMDLAQEGMKEAKDRFDVGLSDALEVIEAQQAMAEARDNYISSVYAHNLARLMLIRSTGTAERDLLTTMGVQQ